MAIMYGPEGPGQFTLGRNLPATIAQPTISRISPPLVDPWVKSLFERTKGAITGVGKGVAGAVTSRLPGGFFLGSGALEAAQEGATPGAITNIGYGLGALASPAFRHPLALAAKLGIDAGLGYLSGVADEEVAKRSPITPELQKQVQAAGGTDKFVQGVQDRTIASLEAQDAAAQKVADAREARVNQVIEQSRQQRAVDEAPKVDFKKALDYSTLGDFMGQVNSRVSYNQAQRAAQYAKFKQQELDIQGAKVAAAMKPDIKIATVKAGLKEYPIVTSGGQGVSTFDADESGNVVQKPVLSAVNQKQVIAQAKEEFRNARTSKAKDEVKKKLRDNNIDPKVLTQ